MIAFALAALTQPAGARADGAHSWISRAKSIVARVHVPERSGIQKQDGTGFLVGFDNRTIYLVTAGHVVWPSPVPGKSPPSNLPDGEKVNIEVEVPGCAQLPAVADSAQASQREDLDVALVKISLTELPNNVRAACTEVLEHFKELPRQIVDPRADSLEQHTPAWLIGPGDSSKGIDSRPLTFDRYSDKKNVLVFSGRFTDGDSGSPVFSDRGHLIGMAIKETGMGTGMATRFSLILAKLARDWAPVPTNLAGPFTRLSFGEQYTGVPLSIDGAPYVAITLPHPVPLGEVVLKLRIDDTQEVTGTVNIKGTDMSCEVTVSRWLARHRRAATYTTLGLAAVTGVAFAIAKTSQDSFEKSPSRSSYDNVGLFKAITSGTGYVALASLVPTVGGYLLSDTTGITCREGQR